MIITSRQIDLWFAYDEDITHPTLLTRYYALLNEEERSRQKRFHSKKHRHQYLITRTLIRTVLSLYEDKISPEKWKFTKNKYGKPRISNSPLTSPLFFNVSHTDKLVVLAVTAGKEVGVDAEYMHRPGKTFELAENFFSPIETQQLYSLPPENQKKRFFDLWTLKEAYIKACGMGLYIPLNHFYFFFSPQGEIKISFEPERDDQPRHWQFWLIHPNDDYKVSVALKNDEKIVSYSIVMRKIIPLLKIKRVNYPIVKKSSF
jgi:4'-phosphopantetheinyl transferase